MVDKVSSLDLGYSVGDLSLFPEGKDSFDNLYRAKNNADSVLKQNLSVTGKFIVVEDASIFPDRGIVRIGSELVYYDNRTSSVLKNIIRGFTGTTVLPWPAGTKVSAAVMGEHHNAIKDAVYNIQHKLGLKENPSKTSLNGILKALENKFLAPRPLFRGFPLFGAPPLQVRFQNFSGGEPIRYFWDFGDGQTSVEKDPIHVYETEGVFTVKLSMITLSGGQGIVTKSNYVTVSNEERLPLFYVDPLVGTTSTEFQFVDQTDGDIVQRYWIFSDGSTEQIDDPDIHTVTHTYTEPNLTGYDPSLLIVFSNGRLKRVTLEDKIVVTE